MWQGTWKHEQIQQLLEGYECEIKKEFELEGLTIVGKADAINKEEILEIKTTDKVLEKAKSWHTEQLTWYLYMFGRQKGRIVQPVKTSDKLYLKVIGEVKRNDKLVERQIKKLKEFHEKLNELV